MRKYLLAAMVAAMAVMLIAGAAFAQTTIDTTGAWNGSDDLCPFGNNSVEPPTATYGQVITVPLTDTWLTDFSFIMDLPSTVVFRGYVYEWNGTMATGPALYESKQMSTAGTGFEQVTFTIPGGVNLTPGGQYVLFASTSKDWNTGTGEGCWGWQPSDLLAGTYTVYYNNDDNTALWTSSAWDGNFIGSGWDMAFIANFLPNAPVANVPTMNEWGMLIFLMLAGIASAMYIRKIQKA